MRRLGKNARNRKINSCKSREGGPQHMKCSFPCRGKVHLRRMAESSNEQFREWEKLTEVIRTYKQAGDAQNLLLTSKVKSIMNYYKNEISIFFLVPRKTRRHSRGSDCGWDGCEDVDAHVSAGVPCYDGTGETERYLPSPPLPASCACCRDQVLCWELFLQDCFPVAGHPDFCFSSAAQSQMERRRGWFNRFINIHKHQLLLWTVLVWSF